LKASLSQRELDDEDALPFQDEPDDEEDLLLL
jgi:hypothetical protein